MLTFRLRRCCR